MALAGCAGSDLGLTLDPEHRISVGLGVACALRDDGRAWCWTREGQTALRPPAGEFVQISIAAEFGFALRDSGEIVPFGFDQGSVMRAPVGAYQRVTAGA